MGILQTYPTTELLTFAGAGILLNLAPGPDVLFATASGLRGGVLAGTFAGLGVGLGGALHMTLAALGLSTLIAVHPAALEVIRWVGAGYLVWLAVQAWRTPLPDDRPDGTVGRGRAIWRGFLANALNPKVILFHLAFIPQFTDPSYGPVWLQIVFLGGLFTVTGTLVTMGYGALAGWMGQGLGRRMRRLNRLSAVMFAGLAAKLMWE